MTREPTQAQTQGLLNSQWFFTTDLPTDIDNELVTWRTEMKNGDDGTELNQTNVDIWHKEIQQTCDRLKSISDFM